MNILTKINLASLILLSSHSLASANRYYEDPEGTRSIASVIGGSNIFVGLILLIGFIVIGMGTGSVIEKKFPDFSYPFLVGFIIALIATQFLPAILFAIIGFICLFIAIRRVLH
jgi:uncharacterized BrkB/YihY/UPF0761 family membrane protein